MVERKNIDHLLLQAYSAIDQVNAVVWSNPHFPPAHKPSVDVLKGRIIIADPNPLNRRLTFKMDPLMKREVLELSQRRIKDGDRINEASKVAMWYPDRRIALSPHLRSVHFDKLQSIITHEFATDTLDQTTTVMSTQYTPFQKREVEGCLLDFFDNLNRPRLEDTYIEKIGFRELIRRKKWLIGDLVQNASELDELYPTMMEIVVQNILGLNGNIAAFDQAAKDGKLTVLNDHPRFSAIMNESMRLVDWRVIMDALLSRDESKTRAIFDQYNHQYGGKLLDAMMMSMGEDEDTLIAMNLLSNGQGKLKL